MKKLLYSHLAAVVGIMMLVSCGREAKTPMRLLYWNIQNGMWDGQTDNYNRFVDWVKSQDPDICVWCEAQSIWITESDQALPKEERYLVDGWPELAARYGHDYVYIGGHRDNYPQAVTSKYPIENIDRIVGNGADTLVSHGAGWVQLEIAGKTINVVTLHTWPQAYGYGPRTKEEREESAARHEGDYYRRTEMEYICNHTIHKGYDKDNNLWMMMGDFNSRSRLDGDQYDQPEDWTGYLVHNYVLDCTPYLDIVKEMDPGVFHYSVGSRKSRIDFVYCTPELADFVTRAEIIEDEYTSPVRDPQNLSNFWHPSDHLPIIVDFEL